MKVNYNGYEVEGSADEIKSLLGNGIKKIIDKRGKYKTTRKYVKRYNAKRILLNKTQKQYILDSKKQNCSFVDIAGRVNRKFGLNLTKDDIKKIYWKIK